MMKQKDCMWELRNSHLRRFCNRNVSYSSCRRNACDDISIYMNYPLNNSDFIDVPYGTDFHYLVRVSTCNSYEPEIYFKSFEERDFISFSILTSKNISRYGNSTLLAYCVPADTIAHIFPTDSNIDPKAKTENELTDLPSFWVSLKELDDISRKLGVYNQITCKTKYGNNQILRPFAVIAINEPTEEDKKVAKAFNVKLIVVHPDKDAINYCGPLYKDYKKTTEVSKKLNELYGISINHHYSKA